MLYILHMKYLHYTTSLRMFTEDCGKLDVIAEQAGINRSTLIRHIIRNFLNGRKKSLYPHAPSLNKTKIVPTGEPTNDQPK
jgi:hypothetical protein